MATALSEDGQVMALRHTSMDIRGLQFHPESVLTPDGAKIISNWLNH
jgi:anthranilate synthase component 2